MGELVRMVNSNRLNLSQFLIMHPFSATESILYKSVLDDIDYFETLYTKSFKTYERLATISNMIDNDIQKLIVITGYRGCGKTNFLQLIKHIFDGYKITDLISEVYKNELSNLKNIDDLQKLAKDKFDESIKRIKSTLFFAENTSNHNDQSFEQNLNSYISEHLTGVCKYINFDEGGMGTEKPFSQKLFYLIRNSIENRIQDANFKEIFSKIKSFVVRNKWLISESFDSENRNLKTFWKNINELVNCLDDDSIYDCLFDEIKKLKLDQLLLVYTIWEYAEISTIDKQCSHMKLMYLLDNIDMIADGTSNVFQNTIEGIWKFVWNARIVFTKIKEYAHPEDDVFVTLYINTKMIVSMRETTAMHISGHLRDKMRGLMDHFDMSTDVDKTMVIQKKIQYCQNAIHNNLITNKNFIDALKCINDLNEDKLLMRNLFLLYNNDYRTSILSLTTVCIEHLDEVKSAVILINSNNSHMVFGGRGIIYRLVLDAFFDWAYFDTIGIASPKNRSHAISLQSQYGYSCSRILLTLLCNKQTKNTERFFVNPEESVKLLNLYAMVKNIMTIDEFVNIIDGMYSLRNKKYWNHLITFDNIWCYTSETIKRYIIENKANAPQPFQIYIRATSAGQLFAGYLCIHFEFFASRFCSEHKNIPLFMLDDMTDKKQFQIVKSIISEVYNGVKNCCRTLEIYNTQVLEISNQQHYSKIVESPYYYEKQFHEERIIHNHISYLEAYRNYILKESQSPKLLTEFNSLIINSIKKYLELLKYDPNDGLKNYRDQFISSNSKKLYNELSVCIEKIETQPSITNIEITRQYYNTYFAGEMCSSFKGGSSNG